MSSLKKPLYTCLALAVASFISTSAYAVAPGGFAHSAPAPQAAPQGDPYAAPQGGVPAYHGGPAGFNNAHHYQRGPMGPMGGRYYDDDWDDRYDDDDDWDDRYDD